MPPLVVVHGAQLRCSMGSTPSNLIVPPARRILVENQPAASVNDIKPNANIPPFGMCRSPTNPQVAAATAAASGVLTPQPCLPVIPAPWTPGQPTVLLAREAALTDDCTCMCQWAGAITVQKPAQTTVFIGKNVVMGGGGAGGQGGNQGAVGTPAVAKSGSGSAPPAESRKQANFSPTVDSCPASTDSLEVEEKKCDLPVCPDFFPETQSFRCVGRGMHIWYAKYAIEHKNRGLVITLRIKLVNREGEKPRKSDLPLPKIGPPVDPATRAKIKSDIEEKLNQNWFLHRTQCQKGPSCDCARDQRCCKIPISIVVDFVESGFHHEVNFFRGQSWANGSNWSAIPKKNNTWAHEAGHLLGFYDEYAGGALGPPPRWRIRPGVLMEEGIAVPEEYFWDFRDWLKEKMGEDLQLLPVKGTCKVG